MTIMTRMLSEVVYQRLATAVDEEVVGCLRLDLGLFDLDLESPEGQKSSAILLRLFRIAWRRIGDDLSGRLLAIDRRPPWLARIDDETRSPAD